ncbi:MAG: HEAT repeat domain-containing protein [Candidatus Hodarchaeales archaeon]
MASDNSDNSNESYDLISKEPEFISDVIQALLTAIMVTFSWYIFLSLYGWILSIPLLGIIITIGVFLLLLPYTLYQISRWLEIFGYKILSMKLGIPYMNYKSKCPFLKRKRLTFYCTAEQSNPYEIIFDPTFMKCHNESMWEECWAGRVPSIVGVFDYVPPKKQQTLAFTLAHMKEKAVESSFKMLEVVNNEELPLDVRLSAAYALAEMKEEKGIPTVLEMLGKYDTRHDHTIRAVIARYKEKAIPYLSEKLNEIESEIEKGVLVEILGKTQCKEAIPVLEKELKNEENGEYVKLQSIYSIQELGFKEGFDVLITYLENAGEEEHEAIKNVCMSNKLAMVPKLIELLNDPDISEEYYEKVGDILADIEAKTYDKIFSRIAEKEGAEEARRLAKILKDNTPEEEEFKPLHEILSMHLLEPTAGLSEN